MGVQFQDISMPSARHVHVNYACFNSFLMFPAVFKLMESATDFFTHKKFLKGFFISNFVIAKINFN